MKKGISRWCFPGEMALKECFSLAKEAGFEGIELAIDEKGEVSLESSDSDLKNIKKMSDDLGIEIASVATGILWNYPMTSNDEATLNMAKKIINRSIEIASIFETNAFLIVPGEVLRTNVKEYGGYEPAYKRSQELLKELSKKAEEYKINLAVENVWNGFLLTPLEMRNFIDEIGSQYVNAYFDVGNVLIFGKPEDWIKVLGKRIKKVHIKDFRRSVGTLDGFVNLLEGDVNWPAVIDALNDIGYDDYLIAEISPPKYYPEVNAKIISIAMDKILRR